MGKVERRRRERRKEDVGTGRENKGIINRKRKAMTGDSRLTLKVAPKRGEKI